MTNDDKTFVLTGFMFIAVFFLLLIALNVFITNAAAIALLASMLTYLFFDKLFYAQKKTDTHAMSNSQNLTKTHNLIKPKYTKEVNYGRNNRGK
ncbi:hypothetical protein [Staphylococcus sp. GDY8P47P]|uniref:hypothetical protein n=1 Tax=Staphylococcus sp. GDY8P47P TaxID=2804491 RepID=UPI00194FAFA7|nr:hypothetical protein [Staphylococcus sp. GDY8P47P]